MRYNRRAKKRKTLPSSRGVKNARHGHLYLTRRSRSQHWRPQKGRADEKRKCTTTARDRPCTRPLPPRDAVNYSPYILFFFVIASYCLSRRSSFSFTPPPANTHSSCPAKDNYYETLARATPLVRALLLLPHRRNSPARVLVFLSLSLYSRSPCRVRILYFLRARNVNNNYNSPTPENKLPDTTTTSLPPATIPSSPV